ncbi:hypothetical protein CLV30_10382 [Haloactinopolyspora alba]|uniref:Uncharacterized protein n=2 Tax=Haloactinopolyspora alba TaxID=648780 RepID=A0A2P8E8X1_9ACTN|nr:hypothetical protein CLV30_10382 [Haloactinopolyspora alba]
MSDVVRASPRRAALTAMLRRLKSGDIAPRELTDWAYVYIGHDGEPDCLPFVYLDDVYVAAEDTGHDIEEVDGWTQEEADAFLDGRPSPGLGSGWGICPPGPL